MGFQATAGAKGEGEIAWGDADFFAVGNIIIEVATKVGIFGLISGSSAHESPFVCVVLVFVAYAYILTLEAGKR